MAGYFWALASTLGFALYQLINRRLVQQSSVYRITLIALLASVGVGVAFAPLLGQPGMWKQLTVMGAIWFALSGVVHFSLGWSFLSLSQRAIGAARTSPLTSITIVLSALLGTVFFAEPFNPTLLVGIGLTVLGIYLISQQN
jgi:drug/metabolite transporter (DMT)-like permease